MEDETNTPPATNNDAEIAQLKATAEAAATALLSSVPEHLKGLIPDSLPAAERIAWFEKAKASGAFAKPAVPATGGATAPTITPQTPDTSSLPVHARLAAGYSN